MSLAEEWRPGIEVFPNTSSGLIQVTGLQDVARMELLDSSGRIIQEFRLEGAEYHIEGLDSGNYFIRVFSDDGGRFSLPVILE